MLLHERLRLYVGRFPSHRLPSCKTSPPLVTYNCVLLRLNVGIMHSTSLPYPPNPEAPSQPPHLQQNLSHPTHPQVPYPVQAPVQAEQQLVRGTFFQTPPSDLQRRPLAALDGSDGQNQLPPAGHSWHYPAAPLGGIASSCYHTTKIPPNPQRKPGRAAQACDLCRQRRTKCDEQRPCSFCKEQGQGQECRYREAAPSNFKMRDTMRLCTNMDKRLHIKDAPVDSATQSAGTPDTAVPLDADDMCMEHVDDRKPSPDSPSLCPVTQQGEQMNALGGSEQPLSAHSALTTSSSVGPLDVDYFTSDWDTHNQEMDPVNFPIGWQGGLGCMGGT
ncbi:hypothetical protein K469DRAFT_752099 [Zopfia rhizophila CBS 207.26]|uniref:Zn(2)-C6 fungal-type domain-containing protein n=1 Tax=Zopfia rhizophila CBS 207.26 TaxID=1314779 RepID=A0A6A6DWR9_9PEZI|nr:hypothetical protein K469DRAFT_752099 [Zopfia rhizophila CBS 207.26]